MRKRHKHNENYMFQSKHKAFKMVEAKFKKKKKSNTYLHTARLLAEKEKEKAKMSECVCDVSSSLKSCLFVLVSFINEVSVGVTGRVTSGTTGQSRTQTCLLFLLQQATRVFLL